MSLTYQEGKTVDPETLQFSRAIKDPAQAHSICKRMVQDNDDRSKKDAAIMRKYNDEQPWDRKKLKAAGQGWRNNRSTGFMSSLIKRVIPAYIKTIDSAQVLTNSILKASGPDAEKKSKAFQVETTKMLRRWHEWHDLNYMLVLDNVLFGRCAVCWTDELDWTPMIARSDEAFFPDGCPQSASITPFWMFKQNFQIHELASKLKDPEISKAVGWNLENLVKAINAAQPEDRYSATQGMERKFEDVVRETTLGASYREGVKVVEAMHLFVQEANAKVTHYILGEKSGDELMTRYDRFASMEECLSLFTVDVGNGKLYGSKGLGRVIYNTHVAVEQARNLIADNLYLSGLLLLKASQKGKDAAAITVTHPFCVLGDNYEVIDHQFKVDADAFFQLDQHMTQLAELQVGAFIPQLQPNVPASTVNYVASVEMDIKEGVLARFWGQYMLMISQIQRRIYSSDNIAAAYKLYQTQTAGILTKVTAAMWNLMRQIGRSLVGLEPAQDDKLIRNKDAVEVCVNLMKQGLEPEEIFELGQSNPAMVLEESPQQTAVATDAVATRYAGNPQVRQNDLIKRDIASKLGHGVADQLVIPAEDNTVTVEATRMQLLENLELLQGDQVPVSPRDNHAVHMGVLEQKAGQLLQGMTPESVTKESLAIAGVLMQHFDMHLQEASKNAKPGELAAAQQFSATIKQMLGQASQLLGGQPQAALQGPAGAVPASAVMNAQAGVASMGGQMETASRPPPRPQAAPNNALSRGPVQMTPKVSP